MHPDQFIYFVLLGNLKQQLSWIQYLNLFILSKQIPLFVTRKHQSSKHHIKDDSIFLQF